jgi:hypothetical protein
MELPKDFYFSQSNLQDYVDCRYRFYLRYILKLKWPALVVDDALDFERRGQIGARFHQLIQQYLQGIPQARVTELAEADPAPELARWWADFLAFVGPNLQGERFVEATLSTALAGHYLLAKFDLALLSEDGKLVIYDWKTSRRAPRKDWLLSRIQTRLYRLILAEAGAELTGGRPIRPDEITMHYWFATQPKTPVTLPYSESAWAADKAYFTSLIEEIIQHEQNQFLRTTNHDKCRFCSYRSHCDRGVRAGDLESFDNFDTRPEDFELDIEFDQIAEIAF